MADIFRGTRWKADGDKLFTSVISPVNSLGHFSITNVNENPEATIRWIDYFWSDEGAKMFFMGLEGETYEETPDEAGADRGNYK